MTITTHRTPAVAELRPVKQAETQFFPLYKNLTQTLVEAQVPDLVVRHVLMVASGYSYSDDSTLATIMVRLGLVDHHCLEIAQRVDAMFIDSTAYLIQSADGRALIVSYRGTIPTSAISWLTDADLYPEKLRLSDWDGTGEATVHGGFYRNVRATRYAVIGKIKQAMRGWSVTDDLPDEQKGGDGPLHKLEALYITGHSLGAAMAALMMLTLVGDDDYADIAALVRGVYTYGQPMVGNGALAEAWAQEDLATRNKLVRFVYKHDVVPQLPPSVSGDFVHFGREYRYDPTAPAVDTWPESTTYTKQIRDITWLAEAPLAFVARALKLTRNLTFHASIDDHMPQHYIVALSRPGSPTEFGD